MLRLEDAEAKEPGDGRNVPWESRFRAVVETMLHWYVEIEPVIREDREPDYRIVANNSRAIALRERLGHPPSGELLLSEFLPSYGARQAVDRVAGAASGTTDVAEFQVTDADGHEMWLHLRAGRLEDGIALKISDITERVRSLRQLEAQNERLAWAEAEARRLREGYELAQRLAGVGTWSLDVATGLVHCSDQMRHLLGLERSPMMAGVRDILATMDPVAASDVRHAGIRALRTGQEVRLEHEVLMPDGERRMLESLFHYSPGLRQLVGTSYDVTDREARERETQAALQRTLLESVELELKNQELHSRNEALRHLATTDGLTGVANHRALQDRLQHLIESNQSTMRGLSLVMVDVDHFKKLNDELGHQAGDEVLRMVGHLLSDLCRGDDLVARYGGEEFALVLDGADAWTAYTIAERIRRAIECHPWTIRAITASFGVATLHKNTTREELIRAADEALYTAKSRGRNRVEVAAGSVA
jgi:diguanylate cyclase (GGDEF)-like protein